MKLFMVVNVDMKSSMSSQLHWPDCDNLDGQLDQLFMISFPRDAINKIPFSPFIEMEVKY